MRLSLLEGIAMSLPPVPGQRRIRQSGFDQLHSAGRAGLYYSLVPGALAFAFIAYLCCGIVAIYNGANVVVVLATMPVITSLLLAFAYAASAGDHVAPDALSDCGDTTPWRLSDGYSDWGLWRAEIGKLPAGVDDSSNRELVRKYIYKLLNDWTRRSHGGGRAVRIFEITRFHGPFDDDPPGCRVYVITLEDHDEKRRVGWLRLGHGWVDFQLVPNGRAQRIARQIVRKTDSVRTSRAVFAPGSARVDPMWDHWLDA
jgi:hypothetical protein